VANSWYFRPVFFVRSGDKALAFYTEALGFRESWRHEHGGGVVVAQVEREGCEIILNESPDRACQSRIFLSLDPGASRALAKEWQARGVEVVLTHWGMPVLSLSDPDGNEILLTDDELISAEQAAGSAG
jgi:catechol 2,3-dioxygenase-like lactoylglutathione lyase family enzyme